MKKVFALALALAMVLSLAAVAFADNSYLKDEDGDVPSLFQVTMNKMFAYDKDEYKPENNYMGEVKTVSFGQTRYFELMNYEPVTQEEYASISKEAPETAFYKLDNGSFKQIEAGDEAATVTKYIYTRVTDSKTVSGLKVTPKWTDGEKYVKSVEIVKKGGAYFVALTTTGSELEGEDLAGKIYLKGTSGTGDNKEKIDHYFDVDLTIEYKTNEKANITLDDTVKKLYVADSKIVYDFEDVDRDEFTVYFVPKNDAKDKSSKNAVASVVADVTNEEEILLFYKVDEVDAVVDAYPDANLDFVALTGKFKKTAEVTLYADEGTYLYKVVDGKVVAMDAEYDEWEEGFLFNTKTLGTYVLSDVELDLDAVTDVTETPEEGTDNPTTGAAA